MEEKSHIMLESVYITKDVVNTLHDLQTSDNVYNNSGINGYVKDIAEISDFIMELASNNDVGDEKALHYLISLRYIDKMIRTLGVPQPA
jgi:hypothetical protein